MRPAVRLPTFAAVLRRLALGCSASSANAAGAVPIKQTSLRPASSSGTSAAEGSGSGDGAERPRPIDQYDPHQYSRGKRHARVICRQKPTSKSWAEKTWQYLKPSLTFGFNVIDNFQLGKGALFLLAPIVVIIWWRRSMTRLPDQWETQLHGLQNKPSREDNTKLTDKTYAEIIDSLEQRREKALERKGLA